MEFQDYYKTLGVGRSASQEEIQKAYRKLARKYHPDINKEADAESTFKRINEAYEVLKDSEKRERYDQVGSGFQEGQSFRPPPGYEGFFSGGTQDFGGQQFAGSGFSDFFESLFGNMGAYASSGGATHFGGGGSRSRSRTAPGQDHEAEITLSIEELYYGGKRSITLHRQEPTPTGQVTTSDKSYQVAIPPGTKDGSVIRLAGQGSPGIGGGKAGDLRLRVKVAPHRMYGIDGYHITSRVKIAPWEAVLGGKVPVSTLDGEVHVSVPQGTQSGERLRLKGKGLKKKDGTRGHHYITFQIVVPKEVTEDERKLLEEWQQLSSFEPRVSTPVTAKG